MSKVLTSLLFLSVALSATAADELSVAKEALRDGLWEIAREHAAKDSSDTAKLIILESLAGEGDWEGVSRALNGWKDARGAGFDYYRAVAKGDHLAAMEILRKGGSRAGCVEADLFEAGELAKSGRREEAERIWRAIAADTNASKRALALASVNLSDVNLLRRACAEADSAALRRLTGLRLGMALLKKTETFAEGEKLVRAIVRDSPDAEGAKEAFLSLADALSRAERWKESFAACHEAIETWPDAARLPSVQECRGWALLNLSRREEALEAFRRAGELATDDEMRARMGVKEGDILQELGRSDESMAVYRKVLDSYPKTDVAKHLRGVVEVRELERRGRELYRSLKFSEAAKVFEEVAKADAARRPTMDFYAVLCLYGQGRDDEASGKARALATDCPAPSIRLEAMLWLAKFLYNRRDWKESGLLFAAYAKDQSDAEKAADALLWAARAAFAEEDFARAIQLATQVAARYPESKAKPKALLVQGEALFEEARFDEAILVLECVSTPDTTAEDRVRAQILRDDSLYAMGADNPARYAAALDAYRTVGTDGRFSPGERIVVAFKTARTLEKLKRMKEATDIYYTQVVLAYRAARSSNQRLTDEVRAVFSRAAFRLADEYEGRGRDAQAIAVLRLVATSDVPAADEAEKRIARISRKGSVL